VNREADDPEVQADDAEDKPAAGLTYTGHALERMAERGVSEEEVELALRRRMRTRPGDPGTIWVDGYGTGNRVIPVCVRVADQKFVTTVGWPKEGGRR
jgi:hypothetical protein